MPHPFAQLLSAVKEGKLEEVKSLLRPQAELKNLLETEEQVSARLTKSTEFQLEALSAAARAGHFEVFRFLSDYLDKQAVRYHLADDRQKMRVLLGQAIEGGDLWILKFLLDTQQPAVRSRLKERIAALAIVPEQEWNNNKQTFEWRQEQDEEQHRESMKARYCVLASAIKGGTVEVLEYFATESPVFSDIFSQDFYHLNTYIDDVDEALSSISSERLKLLQRFYNEEQHISFPESATKAKNPNIVKYLLDIHNSLEGEKLFDDLIDFFSGFSVETVEPFVDLATKDTVLLKAVLDIDILSFHTQQTGLSIRGAVEDDEEECEQWIREKILQYTVKNLGVKGLKLLFEEEPDRIVSLLRNNEAIRSAVFKAIGGDEQGVDTLRYLLSDPCEIPFSETLRLNVEAQQNLLFNAASADQVDLLEYLLDEQKEVLQFLTINRKQQLEVLQQVLCSKLSLNKINCLFDKVKGLAENTELLNSVLNRAMSQMATITDVNCIKVLFDKLSKQGMNWQPSGGGMTWELRKQDETRDPLNVHETLEHLLGIEAFRSQIASMDNRALHTAIEKNRSDVARRLLKEPEVRKKVHVLNHKAIRLAAANNDNVLVSHLIEVYREQVIPLPKNVKIKYQGRIITLKQYLDKSLLGATVFCRETERVEPGSSLKSVFQAIQRLEPRVKIFLDPIPFLPLGTVNLIQEFSGTVRTVSVKGSLLSSLDRLEALQKEKKERASDRDLEKKIESEIQIILKLQERYNLTLKYVVKHGVKNGDDITLQKAIESRLGKESILCRRLIEGIPEELTSSSSSSSSTAMDLSPDSPKKELIFSPRVLDKGEKSGREVEPDGEIKEKRESEKERELGFSVKTIQAEKTVPTQGKRAKNVSSSSSQGEDTSTHSSFLSWGSESVEDVLDKGANSTSSVSTAMDLSPDSQKKELVFSSRVRKKGVKRGREAELSIVRGEEDIKERRESEKEREFGSPAETLRSEEIENVQVKPATEVSSSSSSRDKAPSRSSPSKKKWGNG